MPRTIKIKALETSLVGRTVRFHAPGTTHQRTDLPTSDLECPIVAVWVGDDGMLCFLVENPKTGGVVELGQRWIQERGLAVLSHG